MPVLVGSAPNDGNGDPLRTAFMKLNQDVANLNANMANGMQVVFATTPAAAPIPASVAVVFAIADNWSLWAPTSAPGNGQPTSTLVRDASLRWWRQVPVLGGGTEPEPSAVWTDTTAWADSTTWSE